MGWPGESGHESNQLGGMNADRLTGGLEAPPDYHEQGEHGACHPELPGRVPPSNPPRVICPTLSSMANTWGLGRMAI